MTYRVLVLSTQAFCKWRKDPVSQRDWDDANLINAALAIHADELPTRGITAGENRVQHLRSQH